MSMRPSLNTPCCRSTNAALTYTSERHSLHPPTPFQASYMDVQEPASFEDLARELHAPANWAQRVEEAIANDAVQLQHRELAGATEDTEGDVQSMFSALVTAIAIALRVVASPRVPRAVVSGLMVANHIAYRAQMDKCFRAANGEWVLASEVKRDAVLGARAWYRGTRLAQLLAAMYYTGAPTLLVSPTHFKLLYENDARDAVSVWPWGEAGEGNRWRRSLMLGRTNDEEFLRIIAICLLAKGTPFPTKSKGQSAPVKQPRSKVLGKKIPASTMKQPPPLKRQRMAMETSFSFSSSSSPGPFSPSPFSPSSPDPLTRRPPPRMRLNPGELPAVYRPIIIAPDWLVALVFAAFASADLARHRARELATWPFGSRASIPARPTAAATAVPARAAAGVAASAASAPAPAAAEAASATTGSAATALEPEPEPEDKETAPRMRLPPASSSETLVESEESE
jgi:hypothetical protein